MAPPQRQTKSAAWALITRAVLGVSGISGFLRFVGFGLAGGVPPIAAERKSETRPAP